ncbi:MAG: hypothetical protein WAO77_19025 [Sphingobium sp.]|uniref:hypothetical protein n=2 Tax=Sphingobium sp. TaxID=1912891 RepID=UPI003BB10E56
MTAGCPRCGSTDCASNAFPNMPIVKIANGVIAERPPNWLRDTLSQLMLWLAITAANKVRPPIKCNYCGNVFG